MVINRINSQRQSNQHGNDVLYESINTTLSVMYEYVTYNTSAHTTDLTEIHHNALVHFLPQMSSEDLDQRDLQRRDFAVHENTGQVELHLKADVDLTRQKSIDKNSPV